MMGTITISASYGAYGDKVGRQVAERIGLPFLDRAIPSAVARRLRLSQVSADAHDERAPSRWDRFFSAFSGVDPESTTLGPTPIPLNSLESFRLATESVLREVADTTGAVILGRAGMVVLGGRDDVLCVRLDGPVAARIERVIADGVDEATAKETQKDVDGAREQYASFFYKVQQDDARLYHLIIDSTALPVEACVDIIITAAKARLGGRQTQGQTDK